MTLPGPRSLASVAALVLAMSSGCARETPEEVESKTVVTVETETVGRGDITGVVRATGLVTPAPGAELLVVAPEAGRIAELPKAEGDRVAAGDLLVRFEVPATGAEVARQRAEIARAQAQIDNARAAQARARDLFTRGVAARKEVEDADRDLTDAEAALAQSQAGLAAAESALARVTVRAPFAGVIAKRLHNPGDVVEAATSDPILRLVDPRRLEIVAAISVADVARVTMGARARLAGAEDTTLKVASHPAAVDQATGAVPVRLAITAAGRGLAVGTPVQVEIDAEARTGVLLVPVGAIVREGEEVAVFVVEGDKAARRVITVGVVDAEHAEVTSGLKEGARVITHGQAGLPDGASITVEAPKP